MAHFFVRHIACAQFTRHKGDRLLVILWCGASVGYRGEMMQEPDLPEDWKVSEREAEKAEKAEKAETLSHTCHSRLRFNL